KNGFAVFFEEYVTQLWEQEDDLLEFCTKHFVEFSGLLCDDVAAVAVLIPYELSGPPSIELTSDLLGVLAGLGINVVVETAGTA
ncbi:hypothetical protein OAS39_09110, partial [Pirellulales bacterium]|nr:hypothetical protein [Pirellulales bacterium]